ncbi:hypothetical protein QBC33DRAFT_97712 [Phialemonium atrogriseum]|uniref:Uncharacterized protein n=1 Tax=Phialemonium atrogriseum TaxID=1093897 RepID=A0AAJ0BXN9_9PEZI|nr:uncharacterized protein QBC33DRAFT_97712 [Phialemonium atrogriseum]KAK1766403.1 hypothetical protein QBC33DRAFT_97712 [Phialemonium atrogriseum]
MCELRFYRCSCGTRWTAHKKLSSCDSPEPAVRCPESLCMYVGSPRKPQKGECELCRKLREALESMDDDRGDGEGKGESTGGTS